MKKKGFARRLGMLLLFIGALYTTITSISNITLADIQVWNSQGSYQPTDKSVVFLMDRKVALTEKKTKINQTNKEVYPPKTLEEEIEVDQFPRSKVIATGYTAGIESTGKTPDHPEYGITFSGVRVKRDLYSTIAADLNIYPIGTIMFIPDYGYGVVADKGRAITGNKIDLYYHTVEDVYAEWGKRELEVYIIKLGEGKLTEDELVKLNENESLQVFRDKINVE